MLAVFRGGVTVCARGTFCALVCVLLLDIYTAYKVSCVVDVVFLDCPSAKCLLCNSKREYYLSIRHLAKLDIVYTG